MKLDHLFEAGIKTAEIDKLAREALGKAIPATVKEVIKQTEATMPPRKMRGDTGYEYEDTGERGNELLDLYQQDQEKLVVPMLERFSTVLTQVVRDYVADLIPSVPGEGAPPDLSKLPPEIAARLGDLAAAAFDQRSLMNRALSLDGTFALEGKLPWNTDEVRAAQIPAANGVTNGRSLAKMYAATIGEVDGVRLLSDEAVKRACEEQSNGRDECLIVDTRFGLGFFLPSTFAALAGPGSFGHAGAGGSLGLADRDLGIGFGYAMSKMNLGLSDDPRALNLVEAVKRCL